MIRLKDSRVVLVVEDDPATLAAMQALFEA
jgi:hypothetical protein